MQKAADEQAFTTNLGKATLANIEDLRAEAVKLGEEKVKELDKQRDVLQKAADEQAFTTNLGKATLANIEDLRAEAVKLGEEKVKELDNQKASLQDLDLEQKIGTLVSTLTALKDKDNVTAKDIQDFTRELNVIKGLIASAKKNGLDVTTLNKSYGSLSKQFADFKSTVTVD